LFAFCAVQGGAWQRVGFLNVHAFTGLAELPDHLVGERRLIPCLERRR
jgi:hypothetical protein